MSSMRFVRHFVFVRPSIPHRQTRCRHPRPSAPRIPRLVEFWPTAS
jgi:hypothetical protein